jgi:hypothetical protein
LNRCFNVKSEEMPIKAGASMLFWPYLFNLIHATPTAHPWWGVKNCQQQQTQKYFIPEEFSINSVVRIKYTNINGTLCVW